MLLEEGTRNATRYFGGSNTSVNGPQQKSEKTSASKSNFSRFLTVLLSVILVTIIAIVYLTHDILPSFEFAILVLLIYAVYIKKTWLFIKDWVPFLLIFVSYETLNGLVGTVSKFNIHSGPYYMDKALFVGRDPALLLQMYLRTPVLDWMGAFFYAIYFFVPTAFGFVIWRESHQDFSNYIISLGVLTYSCLATFFVYPVAPPWLNSALTDKGLTRILSSSVDKSLGVPAYKMLYDFFGPNLYAAFPSLHSALPWLAFLFAFKIWKWKALPVLALPVGTWFSAVYLGEHYFTDILGGIIYATVTFVVVVKLVPILSKRFNFYRQRQ